MIMGVKLDHATKATGATGGSEKKGSSELLITLKIQASYTVFVSTGRAVCSFWLIS